MAITKVLAEMTKSISEGLRIVVTDVMRIFSPSDDEYPMIGVLWWNCEKVSLYW
jgi:hypothetical protein